MADLSKNLPKKVGDDLVKSFRGVVRLAGGLDATSAKRIKAAADTLNRTLGRPYDRTKESLVSTTPEKEQLNELIQQRVPPDYANKSYKRLFWRSVYRVVPFLQQKRKTEDRINSISMLALTTFGVIFESLFVHCNALLHQTQSAESTASDPEEGDPDEFDPELDSTTSGLESAIKPSPGKNQHQKKTEENVNRKLEKVTPGQAVKTEEEFRDFVGKHSTAIDACRVAISKHEASLTEALRFSSDSTFSVIHESSLKAFQLSQALATASAAARTELQPGTYLACQGLLKAILTLNNIIIQSVALNRQQRSQINKKLKEMKTRAESPKNTPTEEED